MSMPNDELFQLYDTKLVLRIHNQRNLNNDRKLLQKFRQSIGEQPPSPTLIKRFLSGYTDRSLSTQARYASTFL